MQTRSTAFVCAVAALGTRQTALPPAGPSRTSSQSVFFRAHLGLTLFHHNFRTFSAFGFELRNLLAGAVFFLLNDSRKHSGPGRYDMKLHIVGFVLFLLLLLFFCFSSFFLGFVFLCEFLQEAEVIKPCLCLRRPVSNSLPTVKTGL